MELLRPLVLAQQWDYVVVWKLGNDPSRFIEWMGCCCSGGCEKEDIDIKEVNSEKELFCRDIYLKHYVRTKACESLALFPSSMDLYSGVHTEVVISRQPKWLNQVDKSKSVPCNGDFGTRVFIPVEGGLIELYSSKSIPKDQKVLDLVLAQWQKISFRQETASQSCSTIDGSPSIESSISNPSNQNFVFDSNIEHESRCDEEFPRQKAEKSAKKVNKRKEKGDYQSKNLIAERDRRNRIRNGLLTLRSLVPKITKMDMASILGDAVNYIRDLQMEEMKVRGEFNKLEEEEEECRKRRDDSDKVKGSLNECSLSKGKLSGSSKFRPKKQPEVKVEVNQIGKREFLIKLFIAHKRGGFIRLLEIIDSLNLQVVNTNSIAFNGRVQNILEVKAENDIDPKKLKDFFVELTS